MQRPEVANRRVVDNRYRVIEQERHRKTVCVGGEARRHEGRGLELLVAHPVEQPERRERRRRDPGDGIVEHDDGRARLACVALAAGNSPDAATLHSSSQSDAASMNA